MLTNEQINAVNFYEGIIPKSYPKYLQDEKAYNVLNSLLFPDVSSELARVEENRYLNPNILVRPRYLIKIYKNLLSSFHSLDKELITYRVERLKDYEVMKKYNQLPSFISTSKKGFLSSYQDKKDLVLMIFHLKKDNLVIDFENDLDDYLKKEEQEILLKPGTKLTIVEREPNEEEKSIALNSKQNKIIVCDVYLENNELKPKKFSFFGNTVNAMLYLNDLNNEVYDSHFLSYYLSYKKQIQRRVGIEYETKI